MHDSPQYAYLQTLQRIDAECSQRLNGLEAYMTSQAVPSPTKQRLAAVIRKTKQLFSFAEAETMLDSCPIRSFGRNEQRSVEQSWEWLLTELKALSTSLASGDYSMSQCDHLIDCIEKHSRASMS